MSSKADTADLRIRSTINIDNALCSELFFIDEISNIEGRK